MNHATRSLCLVGVAAAAASFDTNVTMAASDNATATLFSCPAGYRDITGGSPQNWDYGYGCVGTWMTAGPTDNACNCACQPIDPPCCTDACGGTCARGAPTCHCGPPTPAPPTAVQTLTPPSSEPTAAPPTTAHPTSVPAFHFHVATNHEEFMAHAQAAPRDSSRVVISVANSFDLPLTMDGGSDYWRSRIIVATGQHIEIVGAGVTRPQLDALGSSGSCWDAGSKRHFYVKEGGKLTLGNLQLVGGDLCDGFGGAVLSRGDTTVVRSDFFNNIVRCNSRMARGGAIYQEGGHVNIENTTFSENQAQKESGGNQASSAHGGALFLSFRNGGFMTVSNSQFCGNYHYGGSAGAMFFENPILLRDVDFVTNDDSACGNRSPQSCSDIHGPCIEPGHQTCTDKPNDGCDWGISCAGWSPPSPERMPLRRPGRMR